MAFVESSLISKAEEQKWVVEISKILKNMHETKNRGPSVSVSVSIFQVPDTITKTKPEAYVPQQIGLGPIHHFRPESYKKTEQRKLEVVSKVLRNYGNNFENYTHSLENFGKVVPIVRSCYDMFLPSDDDSLARIFAIDGMFLLNLFSTYNSGRRDKERYLVNLHSEACELKRSIEQMLSGSDHDLSKWGQEMMEEHDVLRQKKVVVTKDNRSQWTRLIPQYLDGYGPVLPEVGPENRLLAQDILLVENQIPFMVLKEIHKALRSSSSSSYSISARNEILPPIFRSICKVHSPLKLMCSKSQDIDGVEHLLHYMYYSIVNNVPYVKTEDPQPHELEEEGSEELCGSGLATSVAQLYNFFTKIPQEEIVQAYKQTISFLETFSQTKFLIPSVSKLYDKAEIRFMSLVKHQGIQNIKFELESKSIYLPCITLNNDSEVILRNLVAYETLTANSSSFPLTEYMALMCGLVVNVDDVKLLRNDDIIKGDLSDVEVAKLFIGMKSSIPTMKTEGKSKLRETIHDINKLYESRPRMQTYLLLRKLAGWLLLILQAIGGFVESSWKIVAFMASIVTVVMLMWKAYCDVYGCDKTTVTLLPYASALTQ